MRIQPTRWIVLCAALYAGGLTAPYSVAMPVQDTAPAPTNQAAATRGSSGDAQPLTERQALVRDRVMRLEDRMFQLHEALRKNEPEKAQKLLGALGASRSMLVRQKIDEIISSLKAGQYADARDQQEAVAGDLQTLLKYLLEEPDDSAARKHEMERLHGAREFLERVIKDQQRELDQAQAAANASARNAQLQVAQRALQELAERQTELKNQTQAGAVPPETAAARQRRLAEDTAKQAANLHDLPREASSPATQAAQAAQNAADAMKQAGERLDQADAAGATQAQEQAETALKEAIEQIDQQLRLDGQTPSPREQAAEQEKTARETEQLGGEMKSADKNPAKADGPSHAGGPAEGDKSDRKDSQPSQDGASPPKSPSDSPDSAQDEAEQDLGDNKPLPGQQEVEKAVPLQREAADELRKNKPKDAAEKQAEALKKLKAARELLNDTLEQLRKEQQEMLLAALETRFAAMLAKQLECLKATGALHELGRTNWKRTDQLALADLASGQQWISQEADQALTILKEEGTTVAFPQIVSQIRDDSRAAGDLLAAADVAEITQGLQRGIEEALRELLEAVKKKQEELQSAPDESEGGQSQDQNPPLLPGSAELKLLRSCQVRINSATSRLNTLRTGNDDPSKLAEELKRLAERQKQVSEMAKQMHESLTRTQ